MSAQQEAMAEVAMLIAAIQRLGGTATVEEICAETGLPRARVSRRLAQNGPGMMRVGFRFFTRTNASWGLTDDGRAHRA
jgi:DNA-binding IclR family transcriptional regulator